MKKYTHYLLFSLFLSLSSLALWGQQHKKDSLLQALKERKNDTTCVNTLNSLAMMLYAQNPDTTILITKESAALAKSLNFEKGEANAHLFAGTANYIQNNHVKAIAEYLYALKLYEKTKNEAGIAKARGNMGNIYFAQNDYKRALVCYQKAYDIYKKGSNKKNFASASSNLGMFYQRMAEVYKKENNTVTDSGYSEIAMGYYKSALQIATEINNPKLIATNQSHIGGIYFDKKNYDSAQYFYSSALELARISGDYQGQNIILNALGIIYTHKKNYPQAEKYLTESFQLAGQLHDWQGLHTATNSLASAYEKTGKFKKALEYYTLCMSYKDSLNNDEDLKKQTQLEMQFEFDKQLATDSVRNEEARKREEQKHQEELARKNIFAGVGVVGFVLMVIIALISYRAAKQKQKANDIISQQKNMVEEKQKEILDSIRYAKRIQQSLMPGEKYMEVKLKKLNRKN